MPEENSCACKYIIYIGQLANQEKYFFPSFPFRFLSVTVCPSCVLDLDAINQEEELKKENSANL